MPDPTDYTALVDVIFMPDRKRRTQPRKIPAGTKFAATTLTPADIKALLAAKHIAAVSAEPAATVENSPIAHEAEPAATVEHAGA